MHKYISWRPIPLYLYSKEPMLVMKLDSVNSDSKQMLGNIIIRPMNIQKIMIDWEVYESS